ncbi:hypothetical protein UFOVP228_92 [uncultured Caudovirales phage]|uniref:Uncharacterized protein n=1 Tax=uncultured Caudovirales phage TaxID=2100421 RepID=A0A6J5T809_9CAUD|nr:hypothetical protein UFOVP47_10 [uncultured Caudovirales phage]CAB5219587.1 hypothetical protein UFOVP228_92 [uncultured Caudovirales phage]
MPYQKLKFRPGIVRDTTALANEGGWYEGNNIRFRMGFPEKIGGWQRISSYVYQGVCRTITAWRTLTNQTLYGVGSHLKMSVALGGYYYDITPIRATIVVAANAFTTTNGSSTVTANVTAHGAQVGDFVTLSGAATAVGGITAAQLTGNFQIVTATTNTFTFVASATATGPATGGNATFAFEISPGPALDAPNYGWGTGSWANGTWGNSSGIAPMRVWNQTPYGELLVFGVAGGAPYLFTPTLFSYGFDRGVLLSSLGGAAGVPLTQSHMFFSPAARILVFCGTNSYANSTYDPLLVRWADSDSLVQWTPAITNQAGEYRLPQGTSIVAHVNARQDTVLLTDTSVYLMQYVGAPYIFSFTRQADNISIASPRAAISANGTVFWMGLDKFYYYDGTVRSLDCPLKNEIFNNINMDQVAQVFAGTNEGFDEVWWYYCSAGSTTPDKYMVFNYLSKIWYYGSMNRTAWLDTPFAAGPLAATPFNNLVTHEQGLDDLSTASTIPIDAYIKSSDFDIGDGQNYAFVRKFLPDVNFAGSTNATPNVTLTVQGRKNPGGTVVATPPQTVTLTATNPDIRFTDELSIRLRARQMNVTIQSTGTGVKWQFGAPRLEVRPDGRAA